jgi:pimeloyl-ACP methyl ester carboxylesterase
MTSAHATPVTRTTDLDGPFSWVDHGGPEDGPVIVAVHGLGGSHANWHDLAPLLTDTHQVLAVDLAGHGRTPRAGRSASVRANCSLLGRFVEQVVDRPVVLLGNSMGAALSILHAAEHPEHVTGLALIGPALPRTGGQAPGRALAKQVALFAVPGLAERSLARRRTRLGAEAFVQATLELTCADPSTVSPELRALAVQVCEERANGPDVEHAFLEAARSLGLLVTRAAAYRSLLASVHAPGIVLQGELDRLVPPAGVEQLRSLQPTWLVHRLPGIGHVPQIEAPRLTAELLRPWLSSLSVDLGPAAELSALASTDSLAGAS